MKTSAWKKILCASLLLLWTASGAGASYYNMDTGAGGGDGGTYEQGMMNTSIFGGKASLPPLLPLSSFTFYQIGDTDLVVTLQGRALPVPEVTHFENNNTQIVLRGVSGARVPAAYRHETTTMVLDVATAQAGPDYVITITTDRPMQMNSLRGVAPSDSYTIRLSTALQQQKLVEEPMLTHQPQTLKVPTGPFAVNIPITLDLREADLRDVFRMLGIQMKKNIIIHDSVPPGQLVTMTLKNEPLSEVYDYLMKAYGITYKEMGRGTIVIGTQDGISSIMGNEETRSYRVAYADPAAVSALITTLTGAANLVVDPRLRTIYATASPAKLEEIAITLQKLDHPGKQIMLQARLLEFTEGATRDVEQAINGVYDHWWFNYSGQGGLRSGYVDDNRLGRNYIQPEREDYAFLPGMADMVTPMQGVWREFDAAIRAIESKNKAKVLASPSVITIEDVPATVSLLQSYPYSAGRDEQLNTIWEKEVVGPKLTMTPTRGRDGIVTIKLLIDIGEVVDTVLGSNSEEMPVTSTRTVDTTVRVKDGEPFVIGGLFRENESNNRWRVPILGQLPLLGELFTYRSTSRSKTQAVIIVVPYILDTPDVAVEYERVMIKQ